MTGRRSPLHDAHAALGARFTDFGGWEMPLSYPSGIVAEHLACRRGAVVFDVSHLGTVRVEGRDALATLQATLTNDLDRIGIGGTQYSHLLAEADASVVDDMILWWLDDERVDVMPNASNTTRVREAIGGTDVTDERVVLAIQGPRARAMLAAVSAEAAAVPRVHTVHFDFAGAPCVAAGTGYTGEDGVECAVAPEVAGRFFAELLAAGCVPAGLGARDSLRCEAGLPLHGHELGPGITPLQAGLGWVVAWSKPRFVGRAALLAERARGPRRLLRGLLGATRRPLRAGMDCVAPSASRPGEAARLDAGDFDAGDLDPVGIVTSGTYSPVLGRGIGLAFLPPGTPDGAQVLVGGTNGDTRDGDPSRQRHVIEATVVRPPFHRIVLPVRI